MWRVTLLAVLLLLVLLLTVETVHAQQENTLTPEPASLNLIPGTPGSDIDLVYWVYLTEIPNGTAYCVLHVTTNVFQGLKANATAINSQVFECNDRQEELDITVPLEGYFLGGNGSAYFINSASVTFVDANGTEIEERTLNVLPVTVNTVPVRVTPGQSVSNIQLSHTPDNPQPGDKITFYTSGNVKFYVQSVGQADVSVQVTIELRFSGGVVRRSVTLGGPVTQTSVTINTPLTDTVTYTVYSGPFNYTIASGQLDLASQYEGESVYASMVVGTPLMLPAVVNNTNMNETVFSFMVYDMNSVYNIKVQVSSNPQCNVVEGENPLIITEPGSYDLVCSATTNQLQGTISIIVSTSMGTDQVQVPFTAKTYSFTIAEFVTWLYSYTFFILIALSLVLIVVGILSMRYQYVTMGVMGTIATLLVYMLPLISAYLLNLMFATAHIPNPTGISYLNAYNIGYYLERSINYTSSKALLYAEKLKDIGIVIGGILVAGGILSGLGNLLPLVQGAMRRLGGMLIALMFAVLFASYTVKLLAVLYPVLIVISITVLFITTIAYAFAGVLQGNYAQALNAVVQFTLVFITILLVPTMLETIDQFKSEYGTWTIPIINKTIPNPFFWLPATILQIIIVVAVLYFAFNRVLNLVSGGPGPGGVG